MTNTKINVEETNLEDLILLGEDKHIPVLIDFPTGETTVKVKALIKQLTLKEMDKINLNRNDPWKMNIEILKLALLKSNGDNFTKDELLALPVGVVNVVSEEIMKISGVNVDQELRNF